MNSFLMPMLAVGQSQATLTGLDWAAIAAYFGILLCVAWWVVSKNRDTAADYFLAGRNLGWWVIGASIFASNIGSEHIVGLAGSGAKNGVALAHYELHAWCLLVLAWVFVPFYARSMVFTMPEFLEKRFSTKSRYVLSIVSIVTFIVSKIAVGIFAGGVVFGTLLPEVHIGNIGSFWIGSISVILLTGIYTMIGGMRAVAYTDAVQVIVLIGGSALLTFYGLSTLGGGEGISHGWSEMRRLCGSDMLNLWKPLVPAGQLSTWSPVIDKDAAGNIVKQAWYFNSNFPWLGMAICAPVIGLWYWCTDQYIVQRALGAPNQKVAREGSIFAAFLKLFPVYLFIIPGLICYALVKSGTVPTLTAAFNDPTGEGSQGAFPMMVKYLLPAGLRGIVVAGLLSALMGSLAGVFNACSTLFTVDIYEKLRPKASQSEIVRMGRIATAIMIAIAIAWLPVVKGAKGLYDYLQSVQGYLAPPIFVVFFFGVFWKRLNAKGCLWSMIIGFVVGMFRMLVDTPVTMSQGKFTYAEGSFLWIINNINFQYFSILITIISAIVMVVVSYLTPPPDEAQIRGLTFATATAEDKAATRASWDWKDVTASCIIMVCITFAYLYFRG
ncbi:MAG TPA: sodium:solute symporter [Verrucomicrobiae bacterium]|nr:sodium:solute symporter [Verrucomicrobiae bacterium]